MNPFPKCRAPGFIFIVLCLSFFLLFPGGCKLSDGDETVPDDEGEEAEININPGVWVEMGPAPIANTGDTGRVSSIAVSASNPDLYYVGGADGGVWKSENGGSSWRPLTDHLPTTAIGAVAVDPTDDRVVYAGSGEANFANHSRHGLGLYKTTDGGDYWEVLAADIFSGRCFSKIVIDPDNTDTLYASITHAGGLPSFSFTTAAGRGHWGAQLPLGVWKSTDGGNNWNQLASGLPGDLSATDLAMDPLDSSVIYAAVGHIFGNSRNGIYKSTDRGQNWTKLGGGLPDTDVGRIAITTTAADSNRIYAGIVMACDATGGGGFTHGIYRSDDGGTSWTVKTTLSIHASYGWYLNVITASPTNPDIVFVGGLYIHKTEDGGDTWLNVLRNQHVDFHALVFDANGRLLSGNDGGVYRTDNLGNSWTPLNSGLGIIQFYAGISFDPDDPSVIYGGTQDNGTLKASGYGESGWTWVLGGDGGCTDVQPGNPSVVFAEYQYAGNLYKSTNYGGSFMRSSSGIDSVDPTSFNAPFAFDPENSDRIYYATNRFYRSTNVGRTWNAISGDLTGEQGAAVRGFAIAPSVPSTIYAGTNNGRVLVSFDSGSSWEVSLTDIPGWPRIMRQFAVDPADNLTAFLAVSYYGTDQVLKTMDGGISWESLNNDLADIPVNTICLDPRYGTRVIYLGTDSGVYHSQDSGSTWTLFGEGLPNCVVNDIKFDRVHNRLIVATQGRGMWRIDTE
jgi:photosystem II stability/assembly factor-like uncharacterized protein